MRLGALASLTAIVDPNFAAWLRREEAVAVAIDTPAVLKWGALAVDTRISSPLAVKADAEAEAVRQFQFMAGPSAIETLRVDGQRGDLIGRVVTLTAPKGGYAAGLNVFVIGFDETASPGGTILTVLRRL